MNFKAFYLTESKNQYEWLGACIDFRRKSKENEQIWHEIMKTKKEISEKEFLKNVNISDVLDEDETWKEWKFEHSEDLKFYKANEYYFVQTRGFEYLWKKSLNESYLSEASQEYNIAKVVADKLSKLLSEIEYSAKRDPKYLKKYKYSNTGMYEVPLKDFIKDIKFPESSVFSHLKNGKLYLQYGIRNKTENPHLLVTSTEDGRTKRTTAGAYFDHSENSLGVYLPFINPKTELPYEGLQDHWKSLLLHELTHYVQDAKEKHKTGTSTLSADEWYSNKIERESYLHELYRHLQDHVSGLISALKNFRNDTEYSKADYAQYVNTSNRLQKMFESADAFKKTIRIDAREIFLMNEKNRNRFDYLSTEHRDIYNKFLEDSYAELKKEFKNVLPTKKLTYK